MKDLIYFPYFEPRNEKWLKFALLYIDEFRPIIPYNRREDISGLYRQIQDETDLIVPYSPDYAEGSTASKNAIKEIELLLSQQSTGYLFSGKNIAQQARNEQDYLIYREKFSHEFENFCIDNELARKHDDGLYVSEEIAYIFMSGLAQEISYKTNSSIISDSAQFTNYANSKRVFNQSQQKKMSLAESIIELKLPQNIDDIEFRKLIEFRNANKSLIENFNRELQKIENGDINTMNSYGFLQNYNEIYSELTNKIVLLGISSALIFSFSVYKLFQNNDAITLEDTKEILGGISGLSGMYYSVKDVLTNIKEKRATVKYLANLQKI
ncbi:MULTISPECIES: hypothetical protein [unclassified Sulfuricurvum]|uniref:hypothetical protein n=1 Tax=unclassified Sulfuricurvum TaxID=2632390 RepID=UPI0002999B57|nr:MULTISPECIES: hypothetical protein [unclassified Sulfuricurvum]AFV98238.1 hypothetical protein B649_09630 [Candidatus Sulfuricurvum sp. RIFRC-1]HBM34768.1 hypothetical protein [Sulfuricurvum sp.]